MERRNFDQDFNQSRKVKNWNTILTEILDAWGFEEKTILTWVKNKMGMGRWLRSKAEFCILAVKGKPLYDRAAAGSITNVLEADVRKHSDKPAEFYSIVDKVCVGSKIDMFSRAPRKGWETWGANH